MAIFIKVLTKIDIERTLSLPDSCLQASPQSQRSHGGEKLQVKDEVGILWNFHCTIRSGVFPKLDIVSGWIQFVRFKQLNTGDAIVLYKDDDTLTGPHYKIEVLKGHGDDYSSFAQMYIKSCDASWKGCRNEEIVKHAERLQA
ncbi:hypothetical protein Goshw_007935 [Gossypium schwendimanii]|uniref:TF-B3 domain-containing protein n=1 Tax=Gossypium schwendimanii TaxID=34291 RepID=A0A7J9MP26_GOSSC|nr:hypothetical protein [Gossypium schwendimanii]